MFPILDLMPGARNCVRNYGFIQKDEKVLIWTDRTGKFDELVVQAIALACEEVGAKVHILSSVAGVNRLSAPIDPLVLTAMESSDVLITALELENAAIVDNLNFSYFLARTGKRCISLICPTPALLASEWARFPGEILWAIFDKTLEWSRRGRSVEFHLTDANGTDLKGGIDYKWGFTEQPPPRPWMFFPGGDMATHPMSPVNGMVVFEHMEGFSGSLSQPVRLTVEDHWVTRIEGGKEASWLEELMGRYAKGRYFSEIAIGVHPKAPVFEAMQYRAPDTILFRHAGSYHAAVGHWPWMKNFDSPLHWDGGGMKPSFSIGGEQLINEGRFLILEDPIIREVAERYGDPDVLLKEIW